MMDRITRTLLDIIGIDSDNRAEKGPIVDYAVHRLEGLGMEVTITGPRDTPAIMARCGQGGMVLSGHLDTVPIGEGWSMPQGHVTVDRVYGRGASDMKGAIAAMLEAAPTLVEEGVPFMVTLTTDEEEGMLGAEALVRKGLLEGARGVVIGEPTGMRVVSREKGVLRLRLTTRGRPGHSSQPWSGENAILKMHRIIGSLGDLVEPPLESTEGRTATITTIGGGTKNNVIPDSCRIDIDVRFPPEDSLDGIRGLMARRLYGQDCMVKTTAELEGFLALEGSPLIQEAVRHLQTQMFSAAYATEAARFAPVVRDIVICGPGFPGTCHIVDEWVGTADLVRFHDFLLHMARFAAQG